MAEGRSRHQSPIATIAWRSQGTLVPFVVAYIGVLGMDPFGVLLVFGLAMVVCGLVNRTPIPVQASQMMMSRRK